MCYLNKFHVYCCFNRFDFGHLRLSLVGSPAFAMSKPKKKIGNHNKMYDNICYMHKRPLLSLLLYPCKFHRFNCYYIHSCYCVRSTHIHMTREECLEAFIEKLQWINITTIAIKHAGCRLFWVKRLESYPSHWPLKWNRYTILQTK